MALFGNECGNPVYIANFLAAGGNPNIMLRRSRVVYERRANDDMRTVKIRSVPEVALCIVCFLPPCVFVYHAAKMTNYGTGNALHWACGGLMNGIEDGYHSIVMCSDDGPRAQAIELLLRHGADTSLKTTNGFTAYDIAKKELPSLPEELFERLKPLGSDAQLMAAPDSLDMKRVEPVDIDAPTAPIDAIAALLVKHGIDPSDAQKLAHKLFSDGFKTPERVFIASIDALRRAGFTEGDVEIFKCVFTPLIGTSKIKTDL